MLTSAVRTAVELAVTHLHPVPDDLDSAVGTTGCHGMDRALKAIERTTLTSLDDLKSLVIFISTDITLSHC